MKDLDFLKTRKIAHRGIYDNVRIFENTLPAFQRAVKYNYIVYLDVRLLIDGTVIVFHDKNLDRMLHVDQKTDKTTYDELSYIAKYNIPTLEEVLEIIHGEVPIIIEFKTETKKYLLENKLAEILDKYEGLFAIQSFNIRTLKWFYKYRPNYVIGYCVGKGNRFTEYLFKKYDFMNLNVFLFKEKYVRYLKEDKVVLGYTVDSLENYYKFIDVYDNLLLDNILEIDKR